MTQDYAPIDLNENTPEPKEDGAYIIYINEEPYRMVSRMTGPLGGYWKDMDFEDCRWSYIAGGIDQQFHPTIQSLIDHDAEVREKVLKPIREVVKDEPSPCAWHDKPDDIVTCGWKHDIIAIRNILKEES